MYVIHDRTTTVKNFRQSVVTRGVQRSGGHPPQALIDMGILFLVLAKGEERKSRLESKEKYGGENVKFLNAWPVLQGHQHFFTQFQLTGNDHTITAIWYRNLDNHLF